MASLQIAPGSWFSLFSKLTISLDKVSGNIYTVHNVCQTERRAAVALIGMKAGLWLPCLSPCLPALCRAGLRLELRWLCTTVVIGPDL